MILGNYTKLNANPGRNIGGFTNPYDWMKLSGCMKFYAGEATVSGVTAKSSFNNGYTPPYSWVLAPNAGGMAMSLTGSSSFVADLIPQYLAVAAFTGSGSMTSTIIGYGNLIAALTGSSSWSAAMTATGNIVISFTGNGELTATIRGDGYVTLGMTGSGTLSAEGSLFLNMLLAMTGSGTLSADASLVVGMICAMSGGGTMTLDITGQKGMEVSMTGTGNLAADIIGFAEMVINLIGSGTLNAGIGAIADMSIDMVVTGTGLTTSNVGAAVWQTLITQYSSDPDSAAAKLLAAGSAGDPWSTNLPASYTGTQAGNILAQIQTLVDELHKIEGLSDGNPMTVTPTNRTAGTINLDITGDGETTTTVTRND
jgi:hypothetical protein